MLLKTAIFTRFLLLLKTVIFTRFLMLLKTVIFTRFFLLQLTASDQTRVVIDDVQINYSGTYMCEVTVTPTFFALMQFANMTVIGKTKKNTSSSLL